MVSILQDADFLIAEDCQGGAVQPDVHLRVGAHFGFQAGGDINAARAGEDVFVRAEEAVGLQHQLTAQSVLIVDDQ